MKFFQINLFLSILCLTSCSNPYSKDNIKSLILKKNPLDTELWELKNIKLNKKEKLDLYSKNNCYKLSVSYEITQKEDCYIIENDSILENNVYINKIKQALEIPVIKEKPYIQGKCFSKKSLDSELDYIIQSEKQKIGSNICTNRSHFLLGNECKEYRKYTEEDFIEEEQSIIAKYNKELNTLNKISNKKFLVEDERVDICEEESKINLFKY